MDDDLKKAYEDLEKAVKFTLSHKKQHFRYKKHPNLNGGKCHLHELKDAIDKVEEIKDKE